MIYLPSRRHSFQLVSLHLPILLHSGPNLHKKTNKNRVDSGQKPSL